MFYQKHSFSAKNLLISRHAIDQVNAVEDSWQFWSGYAAKNCKLSRIESVAYGPRALRGFFSRNIQNQENIFSRSEVSICLTAKKINNIWSRSISSLCQHERMIMMSCSHFCVLPLFSLSLFSWVHSYDFFFHYLFIYFLSILFLTKDIHVLNSIPSSLIHFCLSRLSHFQVRSLYSHYYYLVHLFLSVLRNFFFLQSLNFDFWSCFSILLFCIAL